MPAGMCSPADFETARDTLKHMGKNIVHCGDVGTGEFRPS